MTVRRIGSGGPWEDVVGYSRVVVAGDQAWVSGCTATVDGEVVHPGDAGAQARVAFGVLVEALESAGLRAADVVRTRVYVTDTSRWEEVGRVHGEVFGAVRPATAMIGVASLLHPDMLVEVEADAVRSA
ncbi:Enamine deaminase RidA, house cleaning of reactive enamine intermediates, YjgF/YER057c/UK114 family [Geodermatophilus dictyosporus]|uniref:Enamine deaminase RidA, house cleaning of reactive enamine intermediates, YjgF/YER057c/UK114 family n=1 Tax=Geodermatophilus dictyosporus TaxID=1523247 RepID=A0A1I5PUI3_9ACTN|nr:RidA family protein [Geodermatophilus dictyosporus]SFP37261.1 Enamine deaminase RidA, house cleaning of reactive enamine intermediates, YjgF/YER057c/UK114 family [Geodermatophilus dictyosporus]